MLSAIALAFALGALVLSEDHPYAPVCLLVSGMPVYLSWLGSFLEAHGVVALDRFVTLLDGPLYVSGVLLIAAWSLWILRHERHWNTSDCGDDADDDDDAKFQCIDKFMEWVSPFVAGFAAICFAAIMQLIDPGQLIMSSTPIQPPGAAPITLAAATTTAGVEGGAPLPDVAAAEVEGGARVVVAAAAAAAAAAAVVGGAPLAPPPELASPVVTARTAQPTRQQREQQLRAKNGSRGLLPSISPTSFAGLLAFALFIMWSGASLAGAGISITRAVAAFSFSLIVATGGLFVCTYGSNRLIEHAKTSQIFDEVAVKYPWGINVLKGLFVVTSAPLLGVMLFVSCVNQLVRRCGFSFTKPLGEDRAYWVTDAVHKLLAKMSAWAWTTVLLYAIYWGMAYISIQVVISRFTTLLLSWLISTCAEMDIFIVTGIIWAVGLFLFLLPPVPGVPIYLTGGILLVASGKKTFDGVPMAVVYTGCISIMIKLVACTVQQKVIGERMKGSARIRQLVAINSDQIRTMKVILKDPGLTVAKVAILVGGPDWPTSVLCGILGLPLAPILIGTLPVWALIWPTVLAGTFLYLADQYAWARILAAIFSIFAFSIQSGSLLVAGYYLKQKVEHEGDRLAIEAPIDEEVAELDRNDQRKKDVHTEVTRWEQLPRTARVTLIVSTATMTLSCYIIGFSTNCFKDHGLRDTIKDNLNGDPINLVKPLGRTALGICVVACVFERIFSKWASARTNAEYRRRFPEAGQEDSVAKLDDATGDATTPNPAHDEAAARAVV